MFNVPRDTKQVILETHTWTWLDKYTVQQVRAVTDEPRGTLCVTASVF